jgi:tRNA dimethylallyltransferase
VTGSTAIGIFGPTASGKTAVAEAVADLAGGAVVSADSMQAYRGLPVLTNQPERPTLLVGIWPLDHEGSVGEYQGLAHEAVDGLVAAGRTPVIAGGTGLYLRAALADLELPPAPPHGARERWERLYDEAGPEAAHAALAEQDPPAAAVVHANDRRRVVRALELHEGGSSLRPARDHLWAAESRSRTLLVALDVPAGELAARIGRRTREMFERGVEAEVARALEQPISRTARKVIGLDEVASLPRDEAIEAVALRTRQYAAYQRKWLRRLRGALVVDGRRPPADLAAEIVARARGV